MNVRDKSHRSQSFDAGQWLAFLVVGCVVGAISVYVGYGWLFAIVVMVAALFSRPRLPALGGGLIGLGLGAGALLWFGSQCPPNTICEAAFPMETLVAVLGALVIIGLALTIYAVLAARRTSADERGGR